MAFRTPAALRARRQAIYRYFSGSPQKVFLRDQLNAILKANREEFGLPPSFGLADFIELLMNRDEGALRAVRVSPVSEEDAEGSTDYLKKELTRYIWGEASPYAVALSIRPASYITHASAIFLHGLTDQIPRTIYVNKEQKAKPEFAGTLQQDAIARAFQNKPRTSNYVFAYGDFRFVMLAGKHTGRLEVASLPVPTGERVDVTKVERTLIDSVVRPFYSGGVGEVLKAFEGARNRLSVPTLLATYKKMQYVYPYHQVIGFMLERAGFPPKDFERFRGLGLAHDFYATHRMVEPAYDSGWRLYYPKGI